MGRPSKYTSEFRREALELVRSSELPVAEVARSLGMSSQTLGNWVKSARERREREQDPEALSEGEREELAGLRREVTELRVDREILRRRPRILRGRRSGEPLGLRRGSPSGVFDQPLVPACRGVTLGFLRVARPPTVSANACESSFARAGQGDLCGVALHVWARQDAGAARSSRHARESQAAREGDA